MEREWFGKGHTSIPHWGKDKNPLRNIPITDLAGSRRLQPNGAVVLLWLRQNGYASFRAIILLRSETECVSEACPQTLSIQA
ncbi:hypothetical protein GJAV_G00114030 [Gymnothorax javanicus]|nr:hypothetical protein GJAV_G00114030 [Gymnothorax javanicus]